MDAGRILHYPTIAFHCQVSFSCPSSRRKSKLPRERKHRSVQWALPPKDFHFPSRAQESVDSPITDHCKARKASRFLKADAVPSVSFFLFFLCARNLKSPCAGLQWNERGLQSRERHSPERKRAVDSHWPNDETTLYRKLTEHERLQRKRSKVREGSAFRAANMRCRPTRSVHSSRIAEKVKQYLSGCVPVDEKYDA